jgi:hypothetical protein
MNGNMIRMRRSTACTLPRTLMALLPLAIAGGSLNGAHAATPPTFAVNDGWILEGNEGIQYAVVTVTLSKPAGKLVSVNYDTVDGTAEAGSDYDAVSGTLTFAKGQTRRTIMVPVRGDQIPEPDEYLYVELSNPTKGTKIGDGYFNGVGLVIIGKDDFEDDSIWWDYGTGDFYGYGGSIYY